MEVEFRRTGARRYAVSVIVPGRLTLEMNPAPGYDALMPHDLLHFVVERELGIRYGIFGQLADGGTAGTFHPTASESAPSREVARRRRRLAKRGSKLLRQGVADSAKSEHAAGLCHRAWLARKAGTNFATTPEGVSYSADEIARVCNALDEASAVWVKLGVGQTLTLYWRTVDDKVSRMAAVRPN